MNIPYIVEGEIISVQPFQKGQGSRFLYVCEILFPDGNMYRIPNCIQSSIFGGIGDYYRRRARSREDAEFVENLDVIDQSNIEASVGERVYISFLNGSVTRPIIIGYAQHPNQTKENFDSPEDGGISSPQMVNQYNGLRVTVDDVGQYRVTRRGAPKVTFSPESTGLIGSLFSDGGGALEFDGEGELAAFEMLSGGVIKLSDSSGNHILMDAINSKIRISNNNGAVLGDLSEDTLAAVGDSAAAFDALIDANTSEFIEFSNDDKSINIFARDLLKLESNNARSDIAQGHHYIQASSAETKILGEFREEFLGDHWDHTHGDLINQVDGDQDETIFGSVSSHVIGGIKIQVDGDYAMVALGSAGIHSIGDMTVSSSGSVTVAGASFKLSAGTISIGNGGAELLDLFDQTIDQFDQTLLDIQLLTVTGNLGYPSSVPINAASFAAVQASLAAIKALLNSMMG